MRIMYLAKRTSGKWTCVPKGQATMPPFVLLDGPYENRVALEIMKERNEAWLLKTHKHDTDRPRVWLQ